MHIVCANFGLNAQSMCKGLTAQSKAKAIGQNKISSANQRPGFQMIFFSFWSGLIYCYELCFYGSKVRIVVEDSVHEQRMNPFISPFPLKKRLNVSEYARHGMGEASRPRM